MTLKASRFLSDMTVRPRRSAADVSTSLIVDCTAYAPSRLAVLLASLAGDPRPEMEILLLDDGLDETICRLVADAFAGDDRIVSIHFPALRASPAMGVNAALMSARGSSIRYRTGIADTAPDAVSSLVAVDGPGLDGVAHDRALLAVAGLADPHLLVRPVWAEDLRCRLLRAAGRKDKPLTGGNPLTGIALERDRKSSLYRESIRAIDILDSTFLPDADSILRFRQDWVVPFVARHWPDDPDLVDHRVAGRPISVLLRGRVGTAGAEITYGNFARRFPTSLRLRQIAMNASVYAEAGDDMLVNYRQSSAIRVELHETFRATGRPVLFAMDDNWLRLSENPFFAREPWLSQIDHVKAHIRDADSVLVWSAYSVNDVRELNPRVAVLSTNVPRALLAAAPSGPPPDGRIRYSTITQNVSQRRPWWESAVAEWAAFFRQNADRARLVLYGSQPDLLAMYAEWFDGIDYEVKQPQPYVPYLESLANERIRFVMAPILEHTQFVRSKCPIKLLEATAAGAVLLASDVTAYEAATDGADCIKVGEGQGAWTAALARSLAMTDQEHHAIWRSARGLVERSFTTESQFMRFFAVHHVARLHALLQARAQAGAPAGILIVSPGEPVGRRLAAAWARLLRSRDIRAKLVRSPANVTEAVATACLQGEALAFPLAAVLAPSPDSPWVAAARRAGMACAALADLADVWPSRPAPARDRQPNVLLTSSSRVTDLATEAGWRAVRRVGLPLHLRDAPAEGPNAPAAPVRAALVVADDAPPELADRICALLSEQSGHAVMVADTGRADLVVVAGNGAAVVDAVLSAMAAGRLVFAADSADADELLVHRVSGWTTAAGEPLGDLLAEAVHALRSGAAAIRRAAAATARARSLPDAVLHDLVCALCESIGPEDAEDRAPRPLQTPSTR